MKYRLLATAGHVDHGKTELLKALTGQETDRLDEEQKRGLTIDLGFADMRRDDLWIGFVDVPGHHNFIKNMVSGIGSVQGVVFVVSAAGGWEAQSREHFEIVKLVEPDYCCFVLTKIDRVDDEMQLLAETEIEDAIDGTEYEGSEILPVSSTEKTGIEALKTKLFEEMGNQPDPPDYGKPYCPVDRVFTVKGQGTVMTGSLSGGSLETDGDVVRMPARETGRVRSLQQYHDGTKRVQPGSRVALNVPDWDHEAVERGDVVTVPEAGTVTNRCDGLLQGPESLAGSLDHDRQVLAYLGTDRQPAQLLLANEKSITAEESTCARLHWPEADVFVRPGDKIILRDFSDRHLLGCLTVLAVNPDESLHDTFYQDWLRTRNPVTPETLLESELEKHGMVDKMTLSDGTPYFAGAFESVAPAAESISELSDNWWVNADWLADEQDEIRSRVQAYHEAHPLRRGLPLSELNERYASTEVRDTLLETARKKDVVVTDEVVALTDFEPKPTDSQRDTIETVMASLESDGLETPDRSELIENHPEKIVDYLVQSGRVIRLSGERLIVSDVYDKLVSTVRSYLEENEPARLKDLRDLLGSSRKYVIPFMEYLDRQGVTIRDGDVRRLRTEEAPVDHE